MQQKKNFMFINGSPYETAEDTASITSVKALQAILDYLNRHNMEALHTSTQIIIASGLRLQDCKYHGH